MLGVVRLRFGLRLELELRARMRDSGKAGQVAFLLEEFPEPIGGGVALGVNHPGVIGILSPILYNLVPLWAVNIIEPLPSNWGWG